MSLVQFVNGSNMFYQILNDPDHEVEPWRTWFHFLFPLEFPVLHTKSKSQIFGLVSE